MEMADLRNALSNQIQFNKQSALLAYPHLPSFLLRELCATLAAFARPLCGLFTAYVSFTQPLRPLLGLYAALRIYFVLSLIIIIYFVRAYEEEAKVPPPDNILPRDDFPKVFSINFHLHSNHSLTLFLTKVFITSIA
jgi:hypothetical protein